MGAAKSVRIPRLVVVTCILLGGALGSVAVRAQDACQVLESEITQLQQELRNIDLLLRNPRLEARARQAIRVRRGEIVAQLAQKNRRVHFCRQGPGGADVLTGIWECDDGALYYVRQLGATLWWASLSTDSRFGVDDFQPGIHFSNVFQGRIERVGAQGSWADVPRGTFGQGSGSIAVTLDAPLGEKFHRTSETGGFGGTRWTRVSNLPASSSIRDRFDQTIRNDGDTMHGHLKMYKDNVVVHGTVTQDLHANTPVGDAHVNSAFRYANFMCNRDDNFDEDDIDGDLNLRIQMTPTDRARLDAQPGFWSVGWMNDAAHIRRKLDDRTADPDFGCPGGSPCNGVHPEVIMYGRPAGKLNCDGNVLPLLPGWMERASNSVLWNGWPIEKNVLVLPSGAGPARVFNRSLPVGTRVRVTGFLALDCHGLGGECEEGHPEKHNVELHPVYAIDVLRDPGFAPSDLTGAWEATDVGTYYFRQVDRDVWWLGLSSDRGRTFANVFHGTLEGNLLSGQWADVPMGAFSNSGNVVLEAGRGAQSTALRATSLGLLADYRWEKLYDGPPPPSRP